MRNSKMVFWSELKQRIRFTTNRNFDDHDVYTYIGRLTEPEFEILLEALFYIYEDNEISIEAVRDLFDDLKIFLVRFKQLKDSTLYE